MAWAGLSSSAFWNAAWAARMDDVIGHLRAGLFADIAIFAIGWHLVFGR
mgnify:CR=1 FL=1